MRVAHSINVHVDNVRGKKSGYVPAPNSSKCAIHTHCEHLPSLFSALEFLDFLGWKEMRDVEYSLFNYVWLYRMMTMASCTPGHLSGAILGIYAVLRAQIALLKVHWVQPGREGNS